MNSIFNSECIEAFFRMMNKPVSDVGELAGIAKTALNKVAGELFISKVEIKLSDSKNTNNEMASFCEVLYDDNAMAGAKPIKVEDSIAEGCGGIVLITPTRDLNEDEISALSQIGETIIVFFTRTLMLTLLTRFAFMDTASGAHNFAGFTSRLVELEKKGIMWGYDAFFFNISNFRYVNKKLPYHVGDRILVKYVSIINAFLKEGEILSRLGGDNFVALVEKERSDAFINLLQNMEIDFQHERKNYSFSFGATIGCAHLKDAKVAESVMNCVSIAYTVARRTRKVQYYTDNMHKQVMEEKELMVHFQQGMKKKEFKVFFQPKVNAKELKLVGAEGLVRWMHEGREIPPSNFIPMLEQSGDICELDFYLLEEVCSYIRKRIDANKDNVCVSVNFSKKNLYDPDMASKILSIVDKYEVPHELIEVELTESQDYEDYRKMNELIIALQEMGIRVLVDDFGTGSSSLIMLKNTKPKVIKIDKSFIPEINETDNIDRDIMMLHYIVSLAKEFNASVIAEGVETKEQIDLVVGAGCNIIQGYYFDGPLDEDRFASRIDNKLFYQDKIK